MLFDALRALFGLLATLGLFALGVYAMRRWGGAGLAQLKLPNDRRLSVIETLYLDGAHRLVLVRIDEEERLILVGEGREVTTSEKKRRVLDRLGSV